MKDVIIGLSANINTDANPTNNYLNNNYIEAMYKVNATPIMLPVTSKDSILDRYINLCDGFIFTGGKDISPIFYNEEPQPKLGNTSLKLDTYQLKLLTKALKTNKPILAICRGMQALNVVLGGTLHQDISDSKIKHTQDTDPYDISHKVNIKDNTILSTIFDSELYVNSKHHQAIDKLGNNLVVSAISNDDIIEAIELKDHKFCIGIQWHPEILLEANNTMLALFEAFYKACKE